VAAAVMIIDLDRFKDVNDTLGHHNGDLLLQQIGPRITSVLRESDSTARLGGDEFAILLERSDREHAEKVASRLVDALRAPFVLEGRELSVHASIGIAEANQGSLSEELLRNADVAMYSAKTNGKGGYAWYAPEMHVRVRRRHELAAALEHAVERDESCPTASSRSPRRLG
jgi:diguanylate cyclase (GGDEF)-like protein